MSEQEAERKKKLPHALLVLVDGCRRKPADFQNSWLCLKMRLACCVSTPGTAMSAKKRYSSCAFPLFYIQSLILKLKFSVSAFLTGKVGFSEVPVLERIIVKNNFSSSTWKCLYSINPILKLISPVIAHTKAAFFHVYNVLPLLSYEIQDFRLTTRACFMNPWVLNPISRSHATVFILLIFITVAQNPKRCVLVTKHLCCEILQLMQ